MKQVFEIYNTICSKYKNKKTVINKLLSFYSTSPDISDMLDNFLYKNLQKNNKLDDIKTFQLIGLLHQKEKEDMKFLKTDERKHFGIYYTDYDIADLITKETLSNYNIEKLLNLKFLEPCAGNGIFVIAFINNIFKNKKLISKENIQKVIDNINCADIDSEAINILMEFLPIYIKFKYNYKIKVNPKNFFIGNLLFNIKGNSITKNNPKIIFDIKNGFDVILTNPPYKLLKENSNKYLKGDLNGESIKDIIKFIRENKIYTLNEGTLNYYKIFTEEITENYTHNTSSIGLLIPVTLLNDKQSEKLRKHLLNNYCFSKIYIIPEKNDFFPDISQAFCFFSINKKTKGKELEINPSVSNKNDFHKKAVRVSINTINQISESMPIVIEDQKGWQILNKIDKNKKIKDINIIQNYRGELDLTLNKKSITEKTTKYQLLKGINIKEFNYTKGALFVDEDFINTISSKARHIKNERIVCQQISNIHAKKRLKFTKIPKDYILGNSCNYLFIEKDLFGDNNLSADYLLGIMNSILLDWRFKITNSNNHISNYEISELPLIIPTKEQKNKIEKIVNELNKEIKNEWLAKLNFEIFNLYQLSKNEINHILDKYNNEELTNTIKQLAI